MKAADIVLIAAAAAILGGVLYFTRKKPAAADPEMTAPASWSDWTSPAAPIYDPAGMFAGVTAP